MQKAFVSILCMGSLWASSVARADPCTVTLTEVAAKQNGLLFVKGDSLPGTGASVCGLNATTGVWCGAMQRLLETALLSTHKVVLEFSGSGSCTAPSTVTKVRLK